MNTVRCNGKEWPLEDAVSIAAMLERIGLAGKRVAVERNGRVVPRAEHACVRLEAGDQIEIIVAVGGG